MRNEVPHRCYSCGIIKRLLFLVHTDSATVRGLRLLENCYDQEWIVLRDSCNKSIRKISDNESSKLSFSLLAEIYDDLVSAINETDVRQIEKNFHWRYFARTVIQNSLWMLCFQAEERKDNSLIVSSGTEINAQIPRISNDISHKRNMHKKQESLDIPDIKTVFDFCYYLGEYIFSFGKMLSQATIDEWLGGNPLRNLMKIPMSFPNSANARELDIDNIADQVVSECYFKFMVAQIRKGQYKLIRDCWYIGVANSRSTVISETFAYAVIRVHCYIYYLAFYESDQYVDKSIKSAAKIFISDNNIKRAFKSFVINIASQDKNVQTSRSKYKYDLFNEALNSRLYDDLKSYEFLPYHFIVKQMVMEEATQDFTTYLSCYLGNYFHRYDVLHAIIGENKASSYYLRYGENGEKMHYKDMKRFFDLMEVKEQVVPIPTDNSEVEPVNMEECITNRVDAAYVELIGVIKERYRSYTIEDAKCSPKISDQEYAKQKKKASDELIKYLRDKFSGLISDNIHCNETGNVFKQNGYCRYHILRFTVFSDSNIEKLISEQYDSIFIALVNTFAQKLLNAGYVNIVEKKDFSDDEWIQFLNNHTEWIVVGSENALYTQHDDKYEDIEKWLRTIEHYTNGDFGNAILVQRGLVKINFKNVRIDIRPETIQEAMGNVQPDPKTGKYRYSPSVGMLVDFTKDELTDYLRNKRRIVDVSLEIGIEIDYRENEKIGCVIIET